MCRRRTTVSVVVQDPLSITATPTVLSLVEGGDSTQISVRLNRIDAGRGQVEVMIDLEGSGLTVSASSLTFSTTETEPQTVAVTATNDVGTATVTFTAAGYTTATVTVEITPAPAIVLSVTPSPLEIVSGMSAELMLTATPTATITISSSNTGIARVAESAAIFLLEGGADNSTTINVFGDRSGTTTLTIKAAAHHTATTASVEVNVLERLSIEVDQDVLSLVEGGDSTQISVRLNRIDAGRGQVEVMRSARRAA